MALIGLTAVGVRADTTDSLPQLTSFQQMVVDAPAGHVFLSQGSNGIVVTDLSGIYQTTLEGASSVSGLALSSDGGTLYAALYGGAAEGTIAAISTSTLSEQRSSYSLHFYNYLPYSLAIQSGKLWISYAGNGLIGIGALDLGTGVFEPNAASGNWSSVPILAADPQDTGVLVAAVPDTASTTPVTSFNVTATPATVIARTSMLTDSKGTDLCSNLTDLAVVPGGSQFIPACFGPSPTESVFSTTTFQPQGTYPAALWPSSVAIAADGSVAAGTRAGSTPEAFVYHPGGSRPVNVFLPAGWIPPGGIAWSPDESELYVVAEQNGSYSLHVYDQPTVRRFTLSLYGPSSAYAKKITLNGSLSLASGPAPTGTSITVTRMGAYGSESQLPPVKTASDGSFTVTDTPLAGTYTYTVSDASYPETLANSATHRVKITGLPVSLRITSSRGRIQYNATVRVTAHLGKTYTDRILAIYARTVGSKKEVLLKRGHVDSHANLTVEYRAPHSKVFSAVFAGDDRYQSRTVTRTVGVWAKVRTKYTGYYATKRTGGHLYHLYRHTARIKAAVTVTPNKHGQCVHLQVQEFYNGSWHAHVTAGCGYLNKYSKIYRYLLLSKTALSRDYRVRSDYVRKSSDHSNLSTADSWFYYIVRK